MKHITIFLLLISILSANAQSNPENDFSINDGKGNLYFSVGSDYRYYVVDDTPDFQILKNPDTKVNTFSQNSGFAFKYNLVITFLINYL